MQKPQGALLSLLIASWLLASGIMLACSGDPSDPWTPLPAATQEPPTPIQTVPAPTVATGYEQPLTPLPAATLSPATTVGRIEGPPPPPLPQAFLESGGRRYQGWRGSYCWPVSANSRVCADSAGWSGFDEAPTVRMKPGNGFRIVVVGNDSGPDQVRVVVFTVLETKPILTRGESVYSIDVGEVPALDLPVGVYFVATFLKFQLGDVFYGFKIEIVD